MNAAWKAAISAAGISLVWGMVGATIMLGIYHAIVVPAPQPRIAVVDLVGLVEEQRNHAVTLASKPGVSEIDDRKIGEQLQRFGAVVDIEAKRLAAERGIVLVQKQAVVAGTVPDLTADLRHIVKGREQ